MLIEKGQLLDKGPGWYEHVYGLDPSKLTLGEWDECIKYSTIANKWPEQIGTIYAREKAKLPGLEREYQLISTYPEYHQTKLMLDEDIAKDEAEDRIQFQIKDLQRQIGRTQLNIHMCEVEAMIRYKMQDDRQHPITPSKYARGQAIDRKLLDYGRYNFNIADQKIDREPIGTAYFINPDAGSDAANGLTVGTAWLTAAQYTTTTTRNPGDTATCKRGATGNLAASDVLLTIDDPGSVGLPIIIRGDFTNAFSTNVDLSGTATATLTFGSKTVTFTADVSGVVAAGEWLVVSGDDAIKHGMCVKSVSTSTVTLYLPYNGRNAGSGKTVTNIKKGAYYGTITDTASRFSWGQRDWGFQGMELRSNSATAGFTVGQGGGFVDACRYVSGASNRPAMSLVGRVVIRNFISETTGLFISSVATAAAYIQRAYSKSTVSHATNNSGIVEVNFDECDFGDGAGTVLIASNNTIPVIRFRNPRISGSSTIIVDSPVTSAGEVIGFQDYNGTVGDNRQYIIHDATDNDLTNQSDTGVTFTSGNSFSMKFTPPTDLSNVTDHSILNLMEQSIYLAASATTLSVRLKTAATTDWTANPTALEMWIEIEYWGHATNNYRRLDVSSNTVSFASSTAEQTISVTFTPSQAGVAIARLRYAKPKETAKSNIFWFNPEFEIS